MTDRPRARELGIVIGAYEPGPSNAITDVRGVRVGHTTIRRPPDIHTGVTAIVPERVSPLSPLPAGRFAGNGYGKLVGGTQLDELGQL
jgi:D-aminopeptidase